MKVSRLPCNPPYDTLPDTERQDQSFDCSFVSQERDPVVADTLLRGFSMGCCSSAKMSQLEQHSGMSAILPQFLVVLPENLSFNGEKALLNDSGYDNDSSIFGPCVLLMHLLLLK
jgi:hypothetical protein